MFSSRGCTTTQTVTDTADVTAQLRDVGRVLAALPLSPQVKAAGRHDLEAAQTAVAAPEPDRDEIAAAVHRMTETLTRAGAFLLAGRALHEPIAAVAEWLGAPGDSIIGLLGRR